MVLERRKLLIPVRLQLIEPRLQRHDRMWPQAEVPQPCITRRPLVDHDPSLQEYPQMSAHRWGRHSDGGREFPGPTRSLAEHFHDLAPGWVGQGLEYEGHIGLGRPIIAHISNS
jgi:hypothetical protein